MKHNGNIRARNKFFSYKWFIKPKQFKLSDEPFVAFIVFKKVNIKHKPLYCRLSVFLSKYFWCILPFAQLVFFRNCTFLFVVQRSHITFPSRTPVDVPAPKSSGKWFWIRVILCPHYAVCTIFFCFHNTIVSLMIIHAVLRSNSVVILIFSRFPSTSFKWYPALSTQSQ